jgi:hypothetical protein
MYVTKPTKDSAGQPVYVTAILIMIEGYEASWKGF